jgi:hypothetical protein
MPGVKPKVKPVKLICGVLHTPKCNLDNLDNILISKFGPIESKSPAFNFNFTDYYASEMGNNLTKQFYSFENLIMPDTLPDIKHATIAIESSFVSNSKRTVNLDPGYLEESKLVLASTKNFSHRIYLRDNIWAEVTMRFATGKFLLHDWTYPDYSQDLAIEYFSMVREVYKKQLEKIMPQDGSVSTS